MAARYGIARIAARRPLPSLARLLDEGPVDPARTMGFIAQAAAALQAAHAAGLVHRDIKPGNLLVSRDGQVKITDFGIARVAGSASVTSPGTLIGTPAYMAPERAAGAPATPAADLYALGIVAYQCLTGRVPFQGEPLAVALAHLEQPLPPLPRWVHAGVAALVADLTAKDPRARPASARQVAERAGQLRDALTRTAGRPLHLPAVAWASPGTETTTVAVRPSPGSRGNAGARRRGRPDRRILAGLNAGAAVAVIAAAGWGIAGGLEPGHTPPAATHRSGPAGSHRPHRAAAAHRISGSTPADQPGQARRPAASRKPPASRMAATPAPARTPTSTPASTATPTPTRTPTPSGTTSPSGSPTQTGTPKATPNPALARTRPDAPGSGASEPTARPT